MYSRLLLIFFSTLLIKPINALPTAPDFVNDVQPILERNCVRCHNPEKIKGGLRMDTYEAIMEGGDSADALVPGKPEKSELLLRVLLRPIDEGVMPDEGKALEPREVVTLEAWIKSGAKWPSGLTLKEKKPEPIKRVPIPNRIPKSAEDAAGIIDEVIALENADEPVITTPPIDDLAYLRRVTIDIIGRIPTMTEIREFESWGDDRRKRLVSKLLSHPRFADRWTIFMADMLRIRSNVEGGNQLLAYVNGSLAQGKPYDILARELISASGRANSNPAVGFILGDDANPMELAAATAQTFLGVRIGCAMCHDHPFDDWRQKEFYELAAFFGKTVKVTNRNRGMVYATEGKKMAVLWPPEDKAKPEDREALRPRFPFQKQRFDNKPQHLVRFEKSRDLLEEQSNKGSESDDLDRLLDAVDPISKTRQNVVLDEAKKDSELLNVHGDIYRSSELRNQLAELIANPKNDFFAQAFVNRIWAELIGHGFVEPLDNFSPYVDLSHASTLDFLSREFVASGFDIRYLIETIALSDTYRRSQLTADVPISERENSEKNFSASPARKMLGEVLYDSVVEAGHLKKHKWPAGANNREIEKQIRVPTGEYIMVEESAQPMMQETHTMAQTRSDGYDLESSLKIDFNSILSPKEKTELESMREASDQKIKAQKLAAMQEENAKRVMKYRTETITEIIDDNPQFDSAMRMQTPAPPSHFLRVFGQPARTGLGEFRDPSSSLRQHLLMLNGRLTNEASRVGPFEPIHKILTKNTDRAIDYAYLEILTRLPTAEEKTDAKAMLAPNSFQGMADLRWVLLNSNEFRFIP
ncbi:MAG: DUF1549 domain-containing protein [Akkermansiaceae bacterium]